MCVYVLACLYVYILAEAQGGQKGAARLAGGSDPPDVGAGG